MSSWLLYEKPGFQGRIIALEEGPTELVNEWAEPEPNQEVGPDGIPILTKPMVIGSIRLAVRVRASTRSRCGFNEEAQNVCVFMLRDGSGLLRNGSVFVVRWIWFAA